MKPHLHRHAAASCPCAMHRMLLTGMMGADRSAGPAAHTGPLPSLVDEMATEPSHWVEGGDKHTRDLFEVAGKGRFLVIEGATVLPMTGGAALPSHDILAVDGVIKAVQPSGGDVPGDALRVDAKGRFVIPGLTDIHTHPPLRHLSGIFAPIVGPDVDPDDITLPYDLMMFLYLAAGVTRIQVMAGTLEELGLREAVRKGQLRAPHMRIASPVIDGSPPVWSPKMCWLAHDADGGRRAAQLIAERGFDFAKPYSVLNREAYTGLVEECHILGIPIMGHIPRDVGVEDALTMGQRGIAHAFEYFYNETGPERFDPASIKRRVKMSADLGVTVQSTIVIARAFEYDVGLLPASEFPLDGFMDPLLRMIMKEDSFFIQGWRNDPVMVERGRDQVRLTNELCQMLVAEGVTLLPGTDTSPSSITAEHSLHHELRILAEDVGMSPLDVLRAATIKSAEYQGEGAVAGTIEPGKRSDLVVLDADPSVDIGATRGIHAVILGDAVLRRDAIDRGLARAKARYDAMPIPA